MWRLLTGIPISSNVLLVAAGDSTIHRSAEFKAAGLGLSEGEHLADPATVPVAVAGLVCRPMVAWIGWRVGRGRRGLGRRRGRIVRAAEVGAGVAGGLGSGSVGAAEVGAGVVGRLVGDSVGAAEVGGTLMGGVFEVVGAAVMPFPRPLTRPETAVGFPGWASVPSAPVYMWHPPSRNALKALQPSTPMYQR